MNSKKTIELESFLSSKKILHSNTLMDHTKGIMFFSNHEKQIDMTTYNQVNHCSLFIV